MFRYRSWLEESYFRPFGQRTISNQALYGGDGVVVLYTTLSSANMIKYVRKGRRASTSRPFVLTVQQIYCIVTTKVYVAVK